jgi:S-formylglutathione hydrolase FrmB
MPINLWPRKSSGHSEPRRIIVTDGRDPVEAPAPSSEPKAVHPTSSPQLKKDEGGSDGVDLWVPPAYGERRAAPERHEPERAGGLFGINWLCSSSSAKPEPRRAKLSSGPGSLLQAPKEGLPPPSAKDLEDLAQRTVPSAFVARVEPPKGGGASPAYGVVLPPHFDPKRAEPYPVITVELPEGGSFESLLEGLALAKLPSRPDAVVVIPESRTCEQRFGVEASGGLAREHVLTWLQDDYHLDFTRHSVIALGKDCSGWMASLESGAGRPERLGGPVVYVDGAWRTLAPTRNWQREFPSATGERARAPIPRGLQKQPAESGTLFATAWGGGNRRVGVYLPPGYDPSSKERYPVLLWMPGAGDTVARFATAGQVTSHLDHMMRGDTQKMIVLIPDRGVGVSDVLKEGLDYVCEGLKGDRDRLSVAGISMGAGDAVEIAERRKVKSLSCHSPMLWSMKLRELTGKDAPAMLIDAGMDEESFRTRAQELAIDLRAQGGQAEFHVHANPRGKVKHNWASWAAVEESWIAFHQRAHGQPGAPRLLPGHEDVASQLPEPKRYEPPVREVRSESLEPRKTQWHTSFDDVEGW